MPDEEIKPEEQSVPITTPVAPPGVDPVVENPQESAVSETVPIEVVAEPVKEEPVVETPIEKSAVEEVRAEAVIEHPPSEQVVQEIPTIQVEGGEVKEGTAEEMQRPEVVEKIVEKVIEKPLTQELRRLEMHGCNSKLI